MCQPIDSEISRHHFCLFAPSTQPFAYALATLASMVKLSEGDDMRQLCIKGQGVLAHCMNIEECMNIEVEANKKPRYHDIKAYIRSSEYPSSATDGEKKFIQLMACQFFLSGEVQYQRNHDSTLLQCIVSPEANYLMEEMHKGLLGAQASGPLLAR